VPTEVAEEGVTWNNGERTETELVMKSNARSERTVRLVTRHCLTDDAWFKRVESEKKPKPFELPS
jgi:hypothetical protein